MLGVAKKVNVGFGSNVERLPAAMREARKGGVRALLAEIAGHRQSKFVDRDARSKEAEARREREVRLAHEGVGLEPLQGGCRFPEREGDKGEEVEAQAPHD